MKYTARVLTAQNGITQLILDAVDETEARQQVIRQGSTLISLKLAGAYKRSARARRRQFSLLLFSQELLALLTAGLSLIEALEGLEEKEADSEIQKIVSKLLLGLRQGKRFSSTLAEQVAYFPPLYIGLIQAAEHTSNLPQTLRRYIEYQQRIDLVGNRVLSAALYPSILLLVGGAVTFFLVGFVVPRFASVYQGSGRSLPVLSQWLLGWGQFASDHAGLLFALLALVVAGVVLALRQFSVVGGVSMLLSKVPALGERYRVYLLARLYLTLGMLLQGGMPLVSALKSTRSVLPPEWTDKMRAAEQSVASGVSLSQAFAALSLTTPISARMLRVGERTGELGNMLNQAAEFHEGELGRFIERFMRVFEPALMAAIGTVVGVIVVLLYMPIFDLAGSLQ